jgi:predicted RNase H-like HicB family nuclease
VEFLVVLEKAERNWAAYSPDVPGCVATGRTLEQMMKRYEKALRMHLQGLREDGLPLPELTATAMTVDLAV